MSQDFFYKPYLSDAESETESEASDDSFDSSPGASVNSAATLGTVGPLRSVTGFPAILQSSNVPSVANVDMNISTTRAFESAERTNTTLFMVNSRDRDLKIYKQPTFFTIRLPRVFKQVKKIHMTQLNLLNSFFNFTAGQSNTNMYVYESGRLVYDPKTQTDVSNAINVIIPDGTYTAADLVTALSNALNTTPLFASYSLGNFINYFQSTGDFSVLFNTPGQVVFNSLTKVYERNQTLANIVARYFQTSQTAGQVSYSYDQCLVAYYYPVIKEMIIAQPLPVPFSTAGEAVPAGYTSWYDYIVFAFTGLNDPYITPIATDTANQAIFDAYRLQNTFTYSLVNQYNVSYNSIIGRLTIAAPSLNQSIASNLNVQYSNYLNALVLSNGFSDIPSFQTAYNGAVNSNSALIAFYNFIQSRFTSNFAVNFGQYSAGYYATLTNPIVTYNPLNRYGWNTTLTPAVSASTISSNSPPPQISTLWPRLQYIPQSEATQDEFISTLDVFGGTSGFLDFSNSGESQLGYTDVFYRQQPTTYVRVPFMSRCRQSIAIMTLPRPINARGSGTEEVYALGPISTPLLFNASTTSTYLAHTIYGSTFGTFYNSSYTSSYTSTVSSIFSTVTSTFTSSYVSSYQSTFYPTQILSTLYDRLDLSGNINFNLYTVTQNMFVSQSYMRTFNQWTNYITAQMIAGSMVRENLYGSPAPVGNVSLTNYRPYFFFQINADQYLAQPNAHFRITVFVESQTNTALPVPLTLTWYKDRAGFMADTLVQLSGNLDYDDPRHWFQKKTYGTDLSGISMIVDVNNLQQTYMSIRVPTAFTAPSGLPFRIYALLTDVYGTYTIATPLDKLDMPYENLSSLYDQFTPASAVFQNPTKSIFDPAVTQLAYDISGVSNNLIDYIIQAGSNFYDPNNIESYTAGRLTGLRYSFGFSTGGATQPPPTVTSWSEFFGSNSCNVIFDAYNSTNQIYLSSLQVPKVALTGNQYTLANFGVPYSQNEFYVKCVPYNSYTSPFLLANFEAPVSTIFKKCSNAVPLATDITALGDLGGPTDLSGVFGMSFFLPPDDIVQLNSFLVKFVYTQPTADTNSSTFTRQSSPLPTSSTNSVAGSFYRNATNRVTTLDSGSNDWDDWYLPNRRNTKIGIFPTAMIENVSTQSLSLSSALLTMSLQKVTQVNDYQFVTGASRTRNPDWGTYYTYTAGMDSETIWDVNTIQYNPGSTVWISTISDPDTIPVYVAGAISSFGYFLTHPQIYNYTYLPQSFGIATSVANAKDNPTLISSYTSDIPNSYTAVPFYKDPSTNTYKVGTFWGLSFTQNPGVPSTATIGADPYFGTVGPYGWTQSSNSTFELYSLGSGSLATQIWYWNAKLSFQSLDQGYDPATDLSTFGGFSGISGEYQDTYMFLYNNASSNADVGDVSSSVSSYFWSWGAESNTRYTAFDDQSGYNYLSYVDNFPVNSVTPEYAVHVRGYDPIPSFNTGIRFIGNNYTDFGNPTLQDLVNEISTLQGYVPLMDSNGDALGFLATGQAPSYPLYNSTISTNQAIRYNPANNAFFSTDYANRLMLFDQSFSTTEVFGKQVGFPGISTNFTGFSTAITQYQIQYSTITQNYIQYTAILSSATGELNQYILSNYGDILPPGVINRTRYTDPIPFQFLFKSELVEPYLSMSDNWGLGYYLGFPKADTYPPRVSITSETFIKIVQNYIYLRLNPEFNINALSLSGKENLSESRDTYSQDQKYFSKILLNNFGSFCQAAVTLPKVFNPTLGRIETMSFQLLNPNGTQISSIDCEYDMVLEITEAITGPKEGNSLQTTTADLDVYQNM